MMNDEFFRRDADVTRLGDISREDMVDETEPTTLEEVIADNAKNPKRVQGDAGSVEQHSLQDLIAVERFLQSKKAARNKGLGIRLTKISPDGSL
jgi:hypothetical protein